MRAIGGRECAAQSIIKNIVNRTLEELTKIDDKKLVEIYYSHSPASLAFSASLFEKISPVLFNEFWCEYLEVVVISKNGEFYEVINTQKVKKLRGILDRLKTKGVVIAEPYWLDFFKNCPKEIDIELPLPPIRVMDLFLKQFREICLKFLTKLIEIRNNPEKQSDDMNIPLVFLERLSVKDNKVTISRGHFSSLMMFFSKSLEKYSRNNKYLNTGEYYNDAKEMLVAHYKNDEQLYHSLYLPLFDGLNINLLGKCSVSGCGHFYIGKHNTGKRKEKRVMDLCRKHQIALKTKEYKKKKKMGAQ